MNHWGRIFFDDPADPKMVKAQPLENHVGNCCILLENFDDAYFHTETRPRLMQAVRLHDEGKKLTFRLRSSEDDNQKCTTGSLKQNREIRYSFAGHRFKVAVKDPYIDGLIRSHHEFSVDQINREKSRLTEREKTTFADDLYLLCMADQIEAELAVKSIENKTDSPRTFMEFTSQRISTMPLIFSVTPWPFSRSDLSLDFQLKVLCLNDRKRADSKDIENLLKNDQTLFMDETVSIILRRD
jgi:CRISPR-associated endonuclease/helicase Cas3